jgi:hypothetical protein
MSNLANFQTENQYESQIVGELSSGTTAPFSLEVEDAPALTLDAGQSVYFTIDPGTSKEESIRVSAISGTTLTVAARGLPKEKGGSATTTAHSGGAKIIMSNNWQVYDDIATAINSKLDNDGSNATTSFDLQVSGTDWRIREDSGEMKFTSDTTAEQTLADLAAAAGTDHKFLISSNDTTADYAVSKITGGDGITATETNDGANETLDLDVDTTDTNKFVKTSSGAGDENKVPVLNASGQLASGFVDTSSVGDPVKSSFNESRVFLTNDYQNTSGGTVTTFGAGARAITAATTNNIGNLTMNWSQLYSDVSGNTPAFIARAKLAQTTNQDGGLGISDGGNIYSAHNNTLTTDHVAFLFADSALVASCADGTTQDKSADLSGTYALTDIHEYYFYHDGSNYKFYIDGNLVHTSSANEPNSGLDRSDIGIRTSANEAKTIDVLQHMVSFDES